ncbi:late competence development ComFB family protein [Candidatus Colwellia aromaticivorans]|uniref:late competence development ComFB family protein n=1 Tax=Candidatus Colwellia aromaticivorans TaxID=2267621 RepID=UPI000DF2999C|nr:late competence development ComFB family protein [Candidatus Colwellia aromaticivorans]
MIISDDIHNYYEKLVTLHFSLSKFDEKYDDDFLADLTCVVLNQLPARYIRHEVDMAFFLPASERFEMEEKVKKAISKAIEFMKINHEANE